MIIYQQNPTVSVCNYVSIYLYLSIKDLNPNGNTRNFRKKTKKKKKKSKLSGKIFEFGQNRTQLFPRGRRKGAKLDRGQKRKT